MQYEWEKKIRAIKTRLWSEVAPKQEFRKIIVSNDLAKQIQETIGTDLNNISLGCTFEGIPTTVDKSLPDGCIIFIPCDPKCDTCDNGPKPKYEFTINPTQTARCYCSVCNHCSICGAPSWADHISTCISSYGGIR